MIRKQLFVDPKLQGAVVARLCVYWLLTLSGTFAVLLAASVATGTRETFSTHLAEAWWRLAPLGVATLFVVPFVVFDVVRVSNRLIGPMIRLHRGMRRLAAGDVVEPIRFRRGDFWYEFAEAFNAVIDGMKGEPARDESADASDHETCATA